MLALAPSAYLRPLPAARWARLLRRLGLLTLLALLIAQVLHLSALAGRAHHASSLQDRLTTGLELSQGWFHLVGTVLLLAFKMVLGSTRWLAGKSRAARVRAEPCVAVLLVSCLAWSLWALGHADVFALGVSGAVLGFGLPPVAAVLLLPLTQDETADPRVARLIALCGLTWLWSLLFVMTQLIGSLSL